MHIAFVFYDHGYFYFLFDSERLEGSFVSNSNTVYLGMAQISKHEVNKGCLSIIKYFSAMKLCGQLVSILQHFAIANSKTKNF